jgi:hypothetical protein
VIYDLPYGPLPACQQAGLIRRGRFNILPLLRGGLQEGSKLQSPLVSQ